MDGGDLSALAEMEKHGARFQDKAGQTTDAIRSLASFGANCVRLRLFVAPDGRHFVVNDLAYTLALARRAKAANQTILLDFHYADTWADPGNQPIPASWTDHSVDGLARQVEAHTYDTIESFRRAGVLPRFVQIGNEVDQGMLWPTGKVWKEKGQPANWDSLATLLKAGAKGVRRATPAGARIGIVVHTATGGRSKQTAEFHQAMQDRGLDYDVAGLSYYPWWHGTLDGFKENATQLVTRFDKDVWVVEAAYPWNDEGPPPAVDGKENVYAWPRTPEGQAAFLRDVVGVVAGLPGGRGLGVLWWHPDSVQVVGGPRVWMAGACALWRADGSPLPAAAALGLPR